MATLEIPKPALSRPSSEIDSAPPSIREEQAPTATGKMADAGSKPAFRASRPFILAFVSLCVVVLAIAFDATSLSVALPIMTVALGGTAIQAFWAGTSFLLASTVLQPSIASLSNIFGRKYVSASAPERAGRISLKRC
jgi:hypothetical protein